MSGTFVLIGQEATCFIHHAARAGLAFTKSFWNGPSGNDFINEASCQVSKGRDALQTEKRANQ
jgi:hypothetical protein